MSTTKKHIFLCLLFLSLGLSDFAAINQPPLPERIVGMNNQQLLLNGLWQFDLHPQKGFEKSGYKPSTNWQTIQVPGECAMQAFAIEHDKPVLYSKVFNLPANYAGNKIILRFDGVYSQARLFINGTFIREHQGGFTRWECDITANVKAGKSNELKLEVTDRKDDISYASGYAHHPIGGILRDVLIYALPQNHVDNFQVETDLDNTYTDASLNISMTVQHSKAMQVKFSLLDPQGKAVPLANPQLQFPTGTDSLRHQIAINHPQKWDAEHPNLYTLRSTCFVGGKEVYSFSRKIGFREIKIKGNQMVVNGKAVKLRGACRHDMHPTLGRTTTAAYDSLDVVLFKKANMNFVRTSHYPPTERFLEFCDQMGLYVECETAICFINTHRQHNFAPADSQDDAAFTGRYLSQLQEMVSSLRNHVSILFWSIGNESVYGTNFQQSYDWVKASDTTRPAIFSYPGTVPANKKCYDILSMHYPGVDGDMDQNGSKVTNFQNDSLPSIFDEWAHVPCYTYATLQDDPNIREFWGISLDKMWSNLFERKGGLGGAIWGFIDETFMLPQPKTGSAWWKEFSRTAKPAAYAGKCVGYGEWGIIDVWRREKPEFWGTKKAYSPIRLNETNFPDFTSNEKIHVPIYNRFDHTNINEISIIYTYKNKKYSAEAPNIDPHKKGIFVIPANSWEKGDEIIVEFFTTKKELIDAYTLKLGKVELATAKSETTDLRIEDNAEQLIIRGDNFSLPFDKKSGLIKNAVSHGEVVLTEGPYLNFDLNFNQNTGAEVREKGRNYIVNEKDWKLSSLLYTKKDKQVNVLLVGTYKEIAVNYSIQIHASGQITINYSLNNEPNGWLREAGVKFHLPSSTQELSWNREAYWNYYPQNYFGEGKGKTLLYNKKKVEYGKDPSQAWELDTHNYYYFADAGANCKLPLTNIAKGMKENIYKYSLSFAANKGSVQVQSPTAELACRLNKNTDDQLILYINSRWDYPEIAWGDYCKALDASPCYGKVTIQLK
jgi:beta-galactosidase